MGDLSGDRSSFTLSLCLYCRTLCSLNKLLVAKTGVIITIIITENRNYTVYDNAVFTVLTSDKSSIHVSIHSNTKGKPGINEE